MHVPHMREREEKDALQRSMNDANSTKFHQKRISMAD